MTAYLFMRSLLQLRQALARLVCHVGLRETADEIFQSLPRASVVAQRDLCTGEIEQRIRNFGTVWIIGDECLLRRRRRAEVA